MSISPFQRLISNTSTVFLGVDRDEAASNAANNIGDHPDSIDRFPTWPSIEKFDNDISTEDSSPFGSVNNPEYIWDQPPSAGQTVAFAIASKEFTIQTDLSVSFNVFLNAFSDNAMESKIELFKKIGDDFVKITPQPSGLGDVLWIAGDPNTPAVGLTETKPHNWQDIRVYSTHFNVPSGETLKIVLSFETTNYLIEDDFPNPAGLQFIFDIYTDAPDYLYVSNTDDDTVEIYDISNSIAPVRVGEFNGTNLNDPRGLAITGTTLYVANVGDDTVEIYDISNPTAPVRVGEFNAGNLNDPLDLAIFTSFT